MPDLILVSRRLVDFANASCDELQQLAQACERASFGLNDEDETYHKYKPER